MANTSLESDRTGLLGSIASVFKSKGAGVASGPADPVPAKPESAGRAIDFVLDPRSVPQFKTSIPFDYENVRRELAKLARPDPSDAAAVSKYNAAYLELYKPFDNSTEFHHAVSMQTFDNAVRMPDFEEMIEEYPSIEVPFLDQTDVSHEHFLPHQKSWAENGFLLLRGMIPDALCDEYIEVRNKLNLGLRAMPHFTPYLEHDSIMKMFCSRELNDIIRDLVGEDVGLHFNLTPFTSSERGWHQDEYLNPPKTYGRYLAAWIAVDDVPEESGPFEFIWGSHKLPTVFRDKVMPYLKEEYRQGGAEEQHWSVHSSMFVSPAYFYKFAKDNLPVTKFLGKKGDVLLWHSRLIHRGSPPMAEGIRRPGIIGHYSPIRTARSFGNDIRRYGDGGYYWHFPSAPPT